jgi:phosphodiesterase/alkaline phosphatase D-like protein
MPSKKIAFVSCAYGTYRPVQPAWEEILAVKPDLLLMLGDNAYMSWYGNHWDFKALEECYRAQFAIKEFRAVIDTVPTLAIWDDHDCGPNDTCGAEVSKDDIATTRGMFNHWMGFALNNNRPHMYCTYDDLPGVKVVMLDVRTYRTSSGAIQPSLLGGAQESWLWDSLDERTSSQKLITIVGSGSAFSAGAPGHQFRDYKGVAEGLKERLAFRAGDGADIGRRALFLGGDVHYNQFVTHDVGFHEAISSGVACFKPRTDSEANFLPARHSDNWGLITIDDTHLQVEFHVNAHTNGNPRRRNIDIASWTVVEE